MAFAWESMTKKIVAIQERHYNVSLMIRQVHRVHSDRNVITQHPT